MKKSIVLMFLFLSVVYTSVSFGSEIVVKNISGSYFQDKAKLYAFLEDNYISVKKSKGKEISKEDLGRFSYVFLLESKRNNLDDIPIEFLDKEVYVKKFLNILSTVTKVKKYYTLQEFYNVGENGGFFYLDYDTPAPVSDGELARVSQVEDKSSPVRTPVSLRSDKTDKKDEGKDIPVSPTVTVVANKKVPEKEPSYEPVLTNERVEEITQQIKLMREGGVNAKKAVAKTNSLEKDVETLKGVIVSREEIISSVKEEVESTKNLLLEAVGMFKKSLSPLLEDKEKIEEIGRELGMHSKELEIHRVLIYSMFLAVISLFVLFFFLLWRKK